MVAIEEIELLNTYYYLSEYANPSNLSHIYKTFTPNVLNTLVKSAADDHMHFTIYNNCALRISKKHQTTHEYTPMYQSLLTDDPDMLDSLDGSETMITEWMSLYWDKPFIMTNPFYMSNANMYIFSNKYATAIKVVEHPLKTALSKGCYTVGNGFILALAMVAIGRWKERNFLNALDILVPTMTSNHYAPLTNAFENYTNASANNILDYPFRFAFQFNTKRIYTKIYDLYQTESFINVHNTHYHVSIYMSSIYIDVKNAEQFTFISHKKTQLFTQYTRLIHNFGIIYLKVNFAQRIKNILDNKSLTSLFVTSNTHFIYMLKEYIFFNQREAFRTIVKTFVLYEKMYQSKRFYNVYLHFCKLFSAHILHVIYYNFFHNLIGDKYSTLPSKRFMRKTIHHCSTFKYYDQFTFASYTIFESMNLRNVVPFEYIVGCEVGCLKELIVKDTSWKDMLAYIDNMFGTTYSTIPKRVVYATLNTVKAITNHHPDAYILQSVLYDYLRTHKNHIV